MRYSAVCALSVVGLFLLAAGSSPAAENWGLNPGAVELKSAGPMAFGPDGVLFVGDPSAATVFAIATDDPASGRANTKLNLSGFDASLAAALGVDKAQVQIKDLVVNPASGNVFLSVAAGQPALVRIDANGKINKLDLSKVKYSKATLANAPPESAAAGRRGRPRDSSITDLAWIDGKLIVSGLAGDSPLSTVQDLQFPFAGEASWTNVEIYHGNHGAVESNSPVRSFVPFKIDGKPVLLAGYTCTPLVMLPLSSLEAGKKVRGTTVAELGNRNNPLDMIVYKKGGKDFVLMSNDNRGVMKISTEKLQENAGINSRVGGTAGQPFETIESLKGVAQMDRLGEDHLIVLAKADDGSLALQTAELP